MKNATLPTLAICLLVIMVLFWLFTQAFHLLSAPSDLSVLYGVLLLSTCLLIIVKLVLYALKKILKNEI